MSGGDRRAGGASGWLLPVAVVAAGIVLLASSWQRGLLKPARLAPVQLIGLGLMLLGTVSVIAASIVGRGDESARPAVLARLLGVFACGVGAIMVICL